MQKITTRELQRSTKDILNRVFQGETIKVCPRGGEEGVYLSTKDPEITYRLITSLSEIAACLNTLAEKAGVKGVKDDWGA